MHFTLAHGTANDFVVLADLDDRLEVSAELARALCDRRRGLGADGVLRLAPPGSDDADVFMDHRNADGSTARMCGNGVRVVAKHMLDHDLLFGPGGDGPRGVVRVATRSGIKHVTVISVHDDGTVAEVSVDMGEPVTLPADVPFLVADDAADDALVHVLDVDDPVAAETAGDTVEFVVVSMGNPHAVLLVDDVDAAPVESVGPWLETHARFPDHVNVGFAQVLSRNTIRLRVWERGVGETAACGTGACAAVVALQRRGLLDDEVAVDLPGGRLTVTYGGEGAAMMAGPAVEVAHGDLDPAWIDALHVTEGKGGQS